MTETNVPNVPGSDSVIFTAQDDNETYRDGFQKLLWFVGIETLAMLAFLALLSYTIYNYRPQDTYFAIGVQGNKEQLVGLREPNMNKNALLAWVAAQTTQIMTFGFDDFDERFAKDQQSFSPEGWTSFKKALEHSQMLANCIKYQQILTSIPISTPIIQAEGLLEGQYRWIVNATLVQTIRAGNKKSTRTVNITMILVKMPTEVNPMGIGINTWIENS